MQPARSRQADAVDPAGMHGGSAHIRVYGPPVDDDEADKSNHHRRQGTADGFGWDNTRLYKDTDENRCGAP